MRINLILILLLAATLNRANGQDTIAKQPANSAYKYWTAKLPLLNILDLSCPNLMLGAERRLDKHNAVQLLGGISRDQYGSETAGGGSVVNGYRLKGEYRRYFHVKRNFAFYAAAEVFYTRYRHYTSDSFISTGSGVHYNDKYYLHKNMWGADVKWGLQRMIGQHFMFEVFAGLGFKSKTVTQTNRSAPSDAAVPKHVVDINLYSIANELGIYTTIAMPVNFVIGYKFR